MSGRVERVRQRQRQRQRQRGGPTPRREMYVNGQHTERNGLVGRRVETACKLRLARSMLLEIEARELLLYRWLSGNA